MNWDRIEGDWKQFVGKVKEKWSKLTDDDIAAINGKREQLRQNPRALRSYQGPGEEGCRRLARKPQMSAAEVR